MYIEKSNPSAMTDLDRLRELERQFVLGCRNWYVLWLWQRYRSFDSATVEDRIRVAEEVLGTPWRGGVAWAWGGSLALIDHLIGRLTDADPLIRQEAAIALGDFEGQGRRAVPALLDRLRSSAITFHDRACAAWALGKVGSATAVVPALLEVLGGTADEPNADRLRRYAADAIVELTNDPDLLLSVARLCLVDRYFECRLLGLHLVETLGELGRELRLLVEPLVEDEVAEVREAARKLRNDLA